MIWNPEKYDNVKTIRSDFLLIGKHKTRGIHPVESEANKSLWRLSFIFGGYNQMIEWSKVQNFLQRENIYSIYIYNFSILWLS